MTTGSVQNLCALAAAIAWLFHSQDISDVYIIALVTAVQVNK